MKDTGSNATAVRAGDGDRVAFVQGAGRGIGLAMTEALLDTDDYPTVFASCRRPGEAEALAALQSRSSRLEVLALDVIDEESIAASADRILAASGRLDLLISCAGILHDGDTLWPEKRLADVSAKALQTAFSVNALGPLLVARGLERVLRASPDARFAALSARVGSISDNRRGGWYAYRASKAALNMMIRTLAIEWGRLPRPIGCFALHPGTVATDLSAPFRQNLSADRVLTARGAADRLLGVLHTRTAEQTGGFFAYDGSRIDW